MSTMTHEELTQVCEKFIKNIWQEFDEHSMDMGDALSIIGVVVEHTIHTLCTMTGYDLTETTENFCDALLTNLNHETYEKNGE